MGKVGVRSEAGSPGQAGEDDDICIDACPIPPPHYTGSPGQAGEDDDISHIQSAVDYFGKVPGMRGHAWGRAGRAWGIGPPARMHGL